MDAQGARVPASACNWANPLIRMTQLSLGSYSEPGSSPSPIDSVYEPEVSECAEPVASPARSSCLSACS
eukprot:2496259-Prymnesium_polylepis.1